jgi:hypothetical protein
MRSVSSVRKVNTRRSAKQFARGHRGGILTTGDARIREHRVERGRELSRAVADEEPETVDVVAEVHHQVAGLLGSPGSVGVRGDAQDVQGVVADLDHEEDVEPSPGHRAVDVEEVDGQHAGGLGAEELPPAGVAVPARCRWDAVALQDPSDR